MEVLRRGRLLVAAPMLQDPNFDRTIVLLLEHGSDGAVGVVLNRPSETEVAAALPAWAGLVAEPGVVFVGGPVGRTVLVGLGDRTGGRRRGDAAPAGEHWTPVLGSIGTIDLGDPAGGAGLARVRIFAGYAGWSGGQLEGELEAGAWFVVDAEPDDAMAADPEELWRTVLRRQRSELRLLANYPRDPVTN